jgi:DNA invertase Pin-like site-specific DNA recombinase
MKRDCPLAPGSIVWAYFRDSGGQEQERSVGQQLDVAREYAGAHGLVLALTFADAARVGSTTAGRDALADMVARARAMAPDAKHRDPGAPAGFLLWDTRRLGRDQLDNAFLKADLRRRGYAIIFLGDDIPAAGDFTPVIEAFLDWKAEQDLRDMARDVQRGLRDTARQGVHPGGFPPRGYRAEQVQIGTKRDGRPRMAPQWVPDPATAHLARLAWEMRAGGASYGEIQAATGLYRTRGQWATFFRNRTYLGVVKCGELEIPDAHEPLCTPEQWAAVQAVTAAAPKPWHDSSPHLLSGLAVCGYCGAPMQAGTDRNPGVWAARKTPWRFYICSRLWNEGWGSCPEAGKIGAERVEGAILSHLLENVLTADYLAAMIDDLRASLPPGSPDPDLAEARAHLDGLDRAIGGLLDVVEQKQSAGALERLAERERERDETLARVAALEGQERLGRELDLPRERVEALVEELRGGLAGDLASMRGALQRMVSSVVLRKEGGTLLLRVPLPLSAVVSDSTPGGMRTRPPHIARIPY